MVLQSLGTWRRCLGLVMASASWWEHVSEARSLMVAEKKERKGQGPRVLLRGYSLSDLTSSTKSAITPWEHCRLVTKLLVCRTSEDVKIQTITRISSWANDSYLHLTPNMIHKEAKWRNQTV